MTCLRNVRLVKAKSPTSRLHRCPQPLFVNGHSDIAPNSHVVEIWSADLVSQGSFYESDFTPIVDETNETD